MKILLISNDQILLNMIRGVQLPEESTIMYHSENSNPLDVMSYVCSTGASILIIDDDFLKPDTAHILQSFRKVKENVDVIFITSDSSIELGKQITQLGIKLYCIKPIDQKEMLESLKSIVNLRLKNIY